MSVRHGSGAWLCRFAFVVMLACAVLLVNINGLGASTHCQPFLCAAVQGLPGAMQCDGNL